MIDTEPDGHLPDLNIHQSFDEPVVVPVCTVIILYHGNSDRSTIASASEFLRLRSCDACVSQIDSNQDGQIRIAVTDASCLNPATAIAEDAVHTVIHSPL